MSVLNRIANESGARLMQGYWTPSNSASVPYNKVSVRVLNSLVTFTEWELSVNVLLHYGENQDIKLKIRKEEFETSWKTWLTWATTCHYAMAAIPKKMGCSCYRTEPDEYEESDTFSYMGY